MSPKADAGPDGIGAKEDLKRLKIHRQLALGVKRTARLAYGQKWLKHECCEEMCWTSEVVEKYDDIDAGKWGPEYNTREKVWEWLERLSWANPKCWPGYEERREEEAEKKEENYWKPWKITNMV